MSKNSVTGFLINDDPFAGLWIDLRCQAILAVQTIGSIFAVLTVRAILASQILEEFLNGKIVQCDFISVRINHFASGGNRFLNVSFPHFVRALAVNSIFAGNTGIALIALITFIAFVSFITLISFGSSISFITLITFISGITFVALFTLGAGVTFIAFFALFTLDTSVAFFAFFALGTVFTVSTNHIT